MLDNLSKLIIAVRTVIGFVDFYHPIAKRIRRDALLRLDLQFPIDNFLHPLPHFSVDHLVTVLLLLRDSLSSPFRCLYFVLIHGPLFHIAELIIPVKQELRTWSMFRNG